MSNLDSFVKSPRPPPLAVATSQEIRDRGSAFIGSAYRANTPADAKAAVHHHKHVVHASKEVYEISAWRCMVFKTDRTGLGGPDDFELKTGYDDGGEQWAGSKVLKVMQTEGVIDAVVIVSRWFVSFSLWTSETGLNRTRFGGTLLGPARFTHIEACTGEVCRKVRKVEEVEECIQTLRTLDDLLATLRAELDSLSASSTQGDGPSEGGVAKQSPNVEDKQMKTKPPDYTTLRQDLDLSKARRLVNARESAIKSVKKLITKRKAMSTE